jgi:hypothetical protein
MFFRVGPIMIHSFSFGAEVVPPTHFTIHPRKHRRMQAQVLSERPRRSCGRPWTAQQPSDRTESAEVESALEDGSKTAIQLFNHPTTRKTTQNIRRKTEKGGELARNRTVDHPMRTVARKSCKRIEPAARDAESSESAAKCVLARRVNACAG